MKDPHNRPVLSDGIVTVRAPKNGDAETRLALGFAEDIVVWFGQDIATMPEMTKDWVENWVTSKQRDPHAYMIEHDGVLSGSVFFHSVDLQDQRAEIAIGLHDPAKLGQGIGTRAMRLLMAHGFDTMGLNRIGLRYLDGNARAAGCYAKLGFVQEGRLRERACIGGVFKDDIQMSCLAREFIR